MADVDLHTLSKSARVSDRCQSVSAEDANALLQALESQLSGTSPIVEAYEGRLAHYFASNHAVAVSSGAAALSIALHAVGVGPGDEVVLTPTPPLCTAYPIVAMGAKPVFCDTYAQNFGIELTDLDRVITSRTRAVIDTPMWGYATPVPDLHLVTKARAIPLILDLAHSHGALVGGEPLSRHAELSCFSTHDRKILSTGEGGFILTDDAELAGAARSYSRFGFLNGKEVGLNFKLGALAAALGQARLHVLDANLERRRYNAARIAAEIRIPGVRELPGLAGSRPSYYFMLLQLDLPNNRRFIDWLDEHGIPSDIKRYGCQPLYKFGALSAYARSCPNAEALLSSVTTIPVHPAIREEELERIVDIINGYREN
jgi:perosamine synthetase